MKVELTRPISLDPSQFQGNVRKLEVAAEETKPVPNGKEKKLELPTQEITNAPITINSFNIRLRFQVDRETGERVVPIVDSESGEVMRQIPPEELLHVMKTLRDLKGLLLATVS